MLNMLNPTANIYISVGQALRRGSDDSDGSRYHRQRHTYLVSIEPHHFHLPGLRQHQANVTHLEATGNNITSHTSRTAPGIIGNVLVAKSAQVTVDRVRKVLAERLKATQDAEDAYADDEDEHRLRLFLRALQDAGITAKFNIDEFVMWTHGYAEDRSNDTAPTLVAYPRAHKEHQQKPVVQMSQTW